MQKNWSHNYGSAKKMHPRLSFLFSFSTLSNYPFLQSQLTLTEFCTSRVFLVEGRHALISNLENDPFIRISTSLGINFTTNKFRQSRTQLRHYPWELKGKLALFTSMLWMANNSHSWKDKRKRTLSLNYLLFSGWAKTWIPHRNSMIDVNFLLL